MSPATPACPSGPVRLVVRPCAGRPVARPRARPATGPQTSIEDLMNIEITSASRKEQRAADVAAAVFVITHDDIRRSGMTTIPDLLRLAPGVDVAQINSNKWAVSVRGFNGLYANKLLVLVDGRSVYNRHLLGRVLGRRGPAARRHRSDRGDSRSRRRHVGRQRRQRRDQHRHQDRGRHAGRARPRRRRALRRTGRRPLRRDARRGAATACTRSGPAGIESLIAPGTRANDASHSVTTGFRADWTTPAGRVHAGGRLHGGPGARAVAQPRPADGRSRADRERCPPTRRAAICSAAGRTRAPAARRCRSSRSSTSRAGRSRSADYHRQAFDVDTQYHTALGDASGSGRRRRLPVHRRAARGTRRLLADPGRRPARRS